MTIRNPHLRSSARGARVVLAIVLALAPGCASDGVTSAEVRSTRLAMTTLANDKPLMLLASLDGRDAASVHFTAVADDIPGNYDELEVRDDALLNLTAPRWSPSGKKVAVVATIAYDQSEVVIYDAESASARVASPNSQIIAGSVDWSPSGGAIAYTMSTQAHFTGIDLFVTNLGSNEVTRLTTGAGLPMSAVRYDHLGSGVYYSKRTGEQSTAPFNTISLVAHVSVTSKQVDTIRTSIVGDVQAISRTGAWALVLRNLTLDGSRYRRDLIRLDLSTGSETVLIHDEVLEWAQLGADDSRGIVALDAGTAGARNVAFDVLDLSAGRRDRLPGAAGAIQVDMSPRSVTPP